MTDPKVFQRQGLTNPQSLIQKRVGKNLEKRKIWENDVGNPTFLKWTGKSNVNDLHAWMLEINLK